MAHFAELDENNIVLQVIVVHNNELKGANGVEYEEQRRRVLSALIWSHATGCKHLIIII